MRTVPFVVTVALFAAAPGYLGAQTVATPQEHFGFAMGSDKQLARWDEILVYFTAVADASDRLQVDTLGATTRGNHFVALTISSPANLARLEEIRAAARRLSKGRIERKEAEALAADNPAVVLINHNIHSTEIGSSQTSVDLVYRLSTADDDLTLEILDNVVTVLVPSANPDGQVMVTDWYRRNVGTDFEKSRMPWLYHHYAGHDNNRDFFQANLVETRYWMELMFHTVYPQVYLDQHQMGQNGPRMFVPPYPDPMNPDVHPLQWQQLKFMGGGIVADLQAAGKEGVITNAMYRIWGQEGALTGRYHNILALLTETASVDIASPVTITSEQLEGSASRARDIDEYGFTMNFVDPWWGGAWTLGDIVDYQTIAAVSVLKQAARFREHYVLGRWQMAAETIQRGKEGPYAYVIPRDQSDPAAAAEMVDRLILQGVEIHRSIEPFEVAPSDGLRVPGAILTPPDDLLPEEPELASDRGGDSAKEDPKEEETGENFDAPQGEAEEAAETPEDAEHDAPAPLPREYPAGSWVVLAGQPSRAAVLDLLQPVSRRLLHEYPQGPYLRSYDGAAYTMPLQWGVETVRVDEPFDVGLVPVSEAISDPPTIPRPRRRYGLRTSVNRSFHIVNRLLKEGVPVSRHEEWFFIPAEYPGAREVLEEMSREFHVPVEADPDGAEGAQPVSMSRVGLYQGWASAMDEGWTRYLFDTYEFTYATLSNEDVRSEDLARDYDVVIIPSEISLDRLVDGIDQEDAPPEYVGGIGDEGVERLKEFVRAGGTLITFERGDEVVLEHFDVPVRNALEGLGDPEFFAPSSLFRLELDSDHPLTQGSPSEVAAKWSGGRVYEPVDWGGEASQISVVGRWAAAPDRVLMSGLLVGSELLAGKPALLDASYGRGRILMYGFRVQHRAQTGGTFRLLFNALHRTGSRPATDSSDH